MLRDRLSMRSKLVAAALCLDTKTKNINEQAVGDTPERRRQAGVGASDQEVTGLAELEQAVDHVFANFDDQFKIEFCDRKYVRSDLTPLSRLMASRTKKAMCGLAREA